MRPALELRDFQALVYRKLIAWAEDASELFSGRPTEIRKAVYPDCTWDQTMAEVLTAHETDDKVKELLMLCCKEGASKWLQHSAEHLDEVTRVTLTLTLTLT